MTWAALPVIAVAAIVLVFGGFLTVWDSDNGEAVFITRIDSSAALVLIAAALAALACVVALWRPLALWIVVLSALLAALLALGIRASVLSDSADVNNYIEVEGGTGGISSPITRAINGPITSVDPDIIGTAWTIGPALLIAGAALAGCSLWLRRRGQAGA